MNNPWTAEQVVDLNLAKELIESQFPQLAPAKLKELGAGWDNTVYEANEQYVFRFPRRQIAVQLLETEKNLLPFIAEHVPLAIPVPMFVGKPTKNFKWPFLGYSKLHGTESSKTHLTDDERLNEAATLGAFLKALHNIDQDKARKLGAPEDTLGRLDPKKRVPAAKEALLKLAQIELMKQPEKLCHILDDAAKQSGKVKTVLAHGDFYSRHFMVDDNRQIMGVIDWGDLHIGDAAIDIAAAHLFLPSAAHNAFKKAYGPIDNKTWYLAKTRAIYSSSILALYAHDIEDKDVLKEALKSLHYLHSPSPPGDGRGEGGNKN